MGIEVGEKKTLIKGKLLIDGMGNPPIEKGSILIKGERIVRIGREKEFKEEANIQVIPDFRQFI